MIQKLEISGVHITVDEDLKKYVTRKIGKLDGYMVHHARTSAHAEVLLKKSKAKDKAQSSCEVVLHVPGEVLRAQETTLNMYAAVDIVEEKMKAQLKKYKNTHTNPKLHQRLIAKLKHTSEE
jgi:putative sigma-54 modulation protein